MKEICGDGPLNKKERILYFIHNFFRGLAGFFCIVSIRFWHSDLIERGLNSPGRKIFNQFIEQEINQILPVKDIEMLDMGCGSGYIRKTLAQLGYSGRYTGIDIKKHKQFDENTNSSFESELFLSGIEEFQTDKKYDLIFSMTALEHIPDDAQAVSICRDLLKPGGVQLHIIPAFSSLFLYFWHGFRQYNPGRLKKIFGSGKAEIYRIGGLFSFFLHFFIISIPSYFLNNRNVRKDPGYTDASARCNKLDRFLPIGSSFYIVVLKEPL